MYGKCLHCLTQFLKVAVDFISPAGVKLWKPTLPLFGRRVVLFPAPENKTCNISEREPQHFSIQLQFTFTEQQNSVYPPSMGITKRSVGAILKFVS